MSSALSLTRNIIPLAKSIDWKRAYNQSLLLIHTLDESLEMENTFMSMEKGFNAVGWIPALSNMSAVVRALLGVTIMVIGAVSSIFDALEVAYYSWKDYRESSPKKIRFFPPVAEIDHAKRKFLNSLRFFSHGVANLSRAIVEFVPLFGNALCFSYDYFLELRLKYNVSDVTLTLKMLQAKMQLERNESQYRLSPELYARDEDNFIFVEERVQ